MVCHCLHQKTKLIAASLNELLLKSENTADHPFGQFGFSSFRTLILNDRLISLVESKTVKTGGQPYSDPLLYELSVLSFSSLPTFEPVLHWHLESIKQVSNKKEITDRRRRRCCCCCCRCRRCCSLKISLAVSKPFLGSRVAV